MYGDLSTAASSKELLERNAEIAKTHEPLIQLQDRPAPSPMPRTFIFCCFDPRVDPVRLLGLNQWDAILLRNVGGHVANQLPDLVYVDSLLGSFEDIFIIQHTDCGSTMMKSIDVKKLLKGKFLGTDSELEQLWLPTCENLEQQVRKNIGIIKNCPFVRDSLKTRTRGFIFDIITGRLQEVE